MNQEQEMRVTPIVRLQNELYSNAVDIKIFLNDFILEFGRYVGGKEKIVNIGNVVMSPPSAKLLLDNLQKSIVMYERKYGPINTYVPGGTKEESPE